MNDSSARPHDELDFEALARGDRVAADVLVERCRGERDYIFDPDVFSALAALSKARSLARYWEALLAQLRCVDVDVRALKRTLKAADEPDDDDNAGDSQAERLLAIAERYEYFCNEFGVPYMSVGHRLANGGSRLETIKIRAKKAKLFFVHEYVLAFGKPPTDAALRGVIDALEARAVYGGEVHPVHIRRARHNGRIYLDCGTEDGSAYEIDKVGWRIVARPPVRFIRTPGMLPLPDAIHIDPKEGRLKLKEVSRFQTERDCVLVVGFLLDALGGEGPYSVLVITGEAGSAKSTLAKLIVSLVDPRSLPLLSAPKSKRDVYINAFTRFLVAYNNLSHLERAISDALCTATEGGADSQRALYTDDDESSIYAKAPFILVAIENVATQGDLADRTLKTEQAAIPPGERITEPEFWEKFQHAAPAVLGALLGALSEGLRRYDSLDQKDLPRLATFAKFVIACETAFWDAGTFAKAFAESASATADDVLSDDPIAAVFGEFMNGKTGWKGTATQLLAHLEAIVRSPEREAELALAKNETRSSSKPFSSLQTDAEKEKDKEAARRVAEAMADLKAVRERVHGILGVRWPKAANALSARLRRLGPQLRAAGIEITWPTSHRDGKVLTITRTPKDVERNRERSSSSSHRPQPVGTRNFNNSDVTDLDHNWKSEKAVPERNGGSSSDRGEDRPRDRPPPLDPDYLPNEPDFSSGFADQLKPRSAFSSDKQHSPGLRKKDEGYAI
jgi:hypothetical protein